MGNINVKSKFREFSFKQISRTIYFFINNKYKKDYKKYNLPDDYKRIYHYHIRKTGGTSLNEMILSANKDAKSNDIYKNLNDSFLHVTNDNGRVYVGWNKYLIEKGDYFYAFSHLPAHSIKLPENTFTITILRDPIKRIISHYNMIKEYKEKNINHYCMKEQGDWLGNSLSDFLDNLPKSHLLRQLYMFSENYDVEEAYKKIIGCSYFFMTEEFEQGIDDLNKKLGLDMKNTLHKKKAKKKIIPTEKEMEKLKINLKAEIELIDRLRKFKYKK